MKLTKFKATISTILAFITSLLGIVATPFYILVLLNIVDYGTGITAAVYTGEKISSNKGFKGIVKKISQWLLVLIGFILDYSICTLSNYIDLVNIKFNSIIALVVVFWLIFNEILSILENLTKIGTPMPNFLKSITKHLQDTTSNTVNINTEKINII